MESFQSWKFPEICNPMQLWFNICNVKKACICILMPSNVLLGCKKCNEFKPWLAKPVLMPRDLICVGRYKSISVFEQFFFCPRTRGKSVIDGMEQGIKILLEQGIIQKVLKESETGKLINTEKLGATMKIRKLIGNGGYRRGSLEVFFPWKRRLN